MGGCAGLLGGSGILRATMDRDFGCFPEALEHGQGGWIVFLEVLEQQIWLQLAIARVKWESHRELCGRGDVAV